jgi:hypothetical protein
MSSWTGKSLLVASARNAVQPDGWSVNTWPFPAPPPNNGLAKSLEEAKQQRYEEMKAQGVRPLRSGRIFPKRIDSRVSSRVTADQRSAETNQRRTA